jgi:hypothetical protein
MRAQGRIVLLQSVLLSKGSSRDICLFLDAIKVRLSLLDVGCGIGVVVGLEVRNSVVSQLEVRLANIGRVIGELFKRRRAAEGDCQERVPYGQSAAELAVDG